MAQHIGLIKINELGEVKESSSINFAEIINHLWTLPNFKNKFPTLSSIDPYSDTIFEQNQIQFLIDDLNKLNLEIKNKKLKNTINEIIKFLTSKSNFRIKFIGD